MNIHNQKEKIIRYIEENRAATTSEISQLLSISWNTAEKYLLELALDQKVIRLKKAGVNLWLRK